MRERSSPCRTVKTVHHTRLYGASISLDNRNASQRNTRARRRSWQRPDHPVHAWNCLDNRNGRRTMTRYTSALVLVFVMLLAGCFRPDSLPVFISSHDRASVYEAVYVHKYAVRLY